MYIKRFAVSFAYNNELSGTTVPALELRSVYVPEDVASDWDSTTTICLKPS